VTGYRVRVLTPEGQSSVREVGASDRPALRLDGVQPGSTVSVKALANGGLESWDWAHFEVPR
jgi:hypothetical protein